MLDSFDVGCWELNVRCSQLFANRDGIAGLQQHDMAGEQIARVDADFLALAGDGDDLRVVVTGVIGRRDGLRQGQSLDPRDIGMLHRPHDGDALPLPRHAGERILLAGQISRPRLGIGLRPGDAAGGNQRQKQSAGKQFYGQSRHSHFHSQTQNKLQLQLFIPEDGERILTPPPERELQAASMPNTLDSTGEGR